MEVDVVGGNAEVFPELEIWGWPIAAYLFLGGLAAGLLVFAGALGFRRDRFHNAIATADLWTIPILVVGLLLLWVDLANRWNAWRLYTAFRPTSAMWWGSWILLVALVVAALRLSVHQFAFLDRLPDRVRHPIASLAGRVRPKQRVLDLVSIPVGASVGLYTGVLLSTIEARPLWDSALLAPLFLLSGLASGGALLCLLITSAEHRRLAPVSMTLCGVESALIAGYLVVLYRGTEASRSSADLLVSGGFAVPFWAFVVALGLLVPLGIEIAERTESISERAAKTAPVLKLGGAVALRFIVLFAGLQTVL
jgi:formate-dependent nitrite reductase membrane component NrfD